MYLQKKNNIERQNIIDEYKEQIAELEAENEANKNGAEKYADFYFETNNQLIKAKELLNDVLLMAKVEHLKGRYETVDEVEQFLKEDE